MANGDVGGVLTSSSGIIQVERYRGSAGFPGFLLLGGSEHVKSSASGGSARKEQGRSATALINSIRHGDSLRRVTSIFTLSLFLRCGRVRLIWNLRQRSLSLVPATYLALPPPTQCFDCIVSSHLAICKELRPPDSQPPSYHKPALYLRLTPASSIAY